MFGRISASERYLPHKQEYTVPVGFQADSHVLTKGVKISQHHTASQFYHFILDTTRKSKDTTVNKNNHMVSLVRYTPYRVPLVPKSPPLDSRKYNIFIIVLINTSSWKL